MSYKELSISSLTQLKPVGLLSSTGVQISLTMTATMIPELAVFCFEELSISQGSCKSVLVCLLLSFENVLTQILFSSHQDQKLTKEEVLDNWNMFVGSQATNYGEDLTRNHDELWYSVPFRMPQTFSPLYWNHCVHPVFWGKMGKGHTHSRMTCINIFLTRQLITSETA